MRSNKEVKCPGALHRLQQICCACLVLCLCIISAGCDVGVHVDENASWNLKVMHAQELIDHSRAQGETIAFLDTGINHELARSYGDRVVAQHNVLTGSDDVEDGNGHGSEMVSLACNAGYMGVYGIASAAKIIVVKITDDEGRSDAVALLKGLRFAQDAGATVVNVSLGGYRTNPKVEKQIREMTQSGISVVAASGDAGDRDLMFPASAAYAISVAALQGDGSLWKDSNTSPELTCAFPGYRVSVLDVVDGNLAVSEDSGTSQACAIASSYIALLRDALGMTSYDEVKSALEKLDTLSGNEVDYVAPIMEDRMP